MIDFPNAPTPGQIFNPGKGVSYIWDGTSWNIVTTASPLTASSKNLVLNASLRISQENGTTASAPATTSNYYPADQWWHTHNGGTAAVQWISWQSGSGSTSGINMVCSVVKASLAATDHWQLIHQIEGLDGRDLKWGTANAVPAVLRFYHYNARVTATSYVACVMSGDGNTAWLGMFTTPAGAGKVHTFAIPAQTGGTWATDNTVGISLRFIMASGSSFIGAPGWNTSPANAIGLPGMTNGFDTAGNVASIFADVGLYADPNNTGLPPPWEVPHYTTELDRCMRYWRRDAVVMTWGTVATSMTFFSEFVYPVPMRIVPTVAYANISYSNVQAASLSTNGAYATHLRTSAVGAGGASPTVSYVIHDTVFNARM
jgi:hypothetical protein